MSCPSASIGTATSATIRLGLMQRLPRPLRRAHVLVVLSKGGHHDAQTYSPSPRVQRRCSIALVHADRHVTEPREGAVFVHGRTRRRTAPPSTDLRSNWQSL